MNPWELPQQNSSQQTTENPFLSQMTPMNLINQRYQSSQSSLNNLQNQTNTLQNQSAYPAYPNAYGLGSPISFDSQVSPPQKEKEKDNSQNMAVGAIQGGNPWSLIGEANTR